MKDVLYNLLIGSVVAFMTFAAIAYFYKAVIVLCIVLCILMYLFVVGGLTRDILKDWRNK